MRMFILMIFSLTTVVGTVNAQEKLQRFESAPCPFEGAEKQEGVKCGYLMDPENRSLPDGRTLRLSVAILKSVSDSPSPDPLVFLSGGPGRPSVKHSMSRSKNPFWTRYRETRDLFFDQRGTGFPDPLFCPELDFTHQTVVFRGLPGNEQQNLLIEAVADCRQTILEKGIDFAYHNGATSAQEINNCPDTSLQSRSGYRIRNTIWKRL